MTHRRVTVDKDSRTWDHKNLNPPNVATPKPVIQRRSRRICGCFYFPNPTMSQNRVNFRIADKAGIRDELSPLECGCAKTD